MRVTERIGINGKKRIKARAKREKSERTDTLACSGKPEEESSESVLSLAFHGLTS